MGVPQLPMVKAVGAYDAASSRCVNSKIARLLLKTPVTLFGHSEARTEMLRRIADRYIAGFPRHKFISRRVGAYP